MKPAAKLWRWFQNNARDLPWRSPGLRDPYRVWLAEIMLQQTQVKTVIPYYEKFLRHYPNVQALARAPLARVLSDWAGLGYYSRARNLHACAVMIAQEKYGEWPRTAKDLMRLPGVGAYTAAAIAALAFGENVLAIDGNVARVLSRVGAIAKPAAAARPELISVGEKLLHAPARGGSAEALIELGALICTPRNPRCPQCPIRAHCAAFHTGTVMDYPIKIKKTAPKVQAADVMVLTRPDGKVLVQTRPGGGLFSGMLALPARGLDLDDEDSTMWKNAAVKTSVVGYYAHVLSHIRFEISVHCAHVPTVDTQKMARYGAWMEAKAAQTQMPRLFAKALSFGA